jgi:hypothetical protein
MRTPPDERAIIEICGRIGRSLHLDHPRDSEPAHIGSVLDSFSQGPDSGTLCPRQRTFHDGGVSGPGPTFFMSVVLTQGRGVHSMALTIAPGGAATIADVRCHASDRSVSHDDERDSDETADVMILGVVLIRT